MDRQEEIDTTREETPSTLDQVSDTMSDTAMQTQEAAVETMESVKVSAAQLGEAARSRMKEASQAVSAQIERVGNLSQERLESLQYQTELTVKRHPGWSLVAGALMGLLVGSLIWR